MNGASNSRPFPRPATRTRIRERQDPRNRIPQYLLGAATAGVALTPQRSEAATVTFSDHGSFTASVGYSAVAITLPDTTTLTISNGYVPTGPSGIGLILSGLGAQQWAHSSGLNATGFGTKTYPIPDVLGPSTLISTSLVTLISPATFASSGIAVADQNWTPQGGFSTAFSNQYVGFKTSSGNYGYLEVSWDPTSRLFQWNGGAVETSGGALSTPSGVTPVPEATSQSGLLALLVTGAVNQLARRRTQRSKAM